MGYALDSKNKWIAHFREEVPLSKSSADRIKRSDVLPLQVLILAHYEIDPYSKKEIKNSELKNFDFLNFIDHADEHSIVSIFRSSIYAGKVKYTDAKSILEPTERGVYANWACEKGFHLPECLTDNVFPWIPPTNIKEVQNADFNNLPESVTAALGSNLFALLYYRRAKRKNQKVKISEIINSKEMRFFHSFCAEAEGKDPREDTTIREHIQQQFQNLK